MDLRQRIVHSVYGFTLSEDQKLRNLRGALKQSNPLAVEIALLQGAKPDVSEIDLTMMSIKSDRDWYLDNGGERATVDMTTEAFIEICKLFRRHGGDLSGSSAKWSDKYVSHPTLLSTVASFNLDPKATEYLLNQGVKPTSSDLMDICKPESDSGHLECIIKHGLNPYDSLWDAPSSFIIPISTIIHNQDREKLSIIARSGATCNKLTMGLCHDIQYIRLSAQTPDGEAVPNYKRLSQEFAIEALEYFQDLLPQVDAALEAERQEIYRLQEGRGK